MTRQERAKQFMPFDAMKGLQEALRMVEECHLRTERKEIGEDEKVKIDRQLSRLQIKQKIRVHCYRLFHDVILEGRITNIDVTEKQLHLDSDITIDFEDIYAVEILLI